uniref:uncharacterized protein LOC101299129 n=1 Tax=Fragaria vesca subsp. vesca TaxID=101020 RepID=UPI0005CA9102|nr:PREDICTED: uncharacterized protein LOC101299129 [Fragaria vesca subsp. vesca]
MEKNGEYKVRSGYDMQHASRNSPSLQSMDSSHIIKPEVWKFIWSSLTLPKVKHFLWRVCTNSLPTMKNLFSKRIAPSPMCPFCLLYEESIEHLLLQCSWTAGVWFRLPISYKVDPALITTFDDWFYGVCGLLKQNSRAWEILSCWVSFALWNIWKEMCTFLYEHRDPNAWGVIESVKYVVAEFSGITDHPPQVGVEEKCKMKDGPDMWSAPLGLNIKINCDGAWDAYSNLARIGVIARNSSGAVINGCAKSCYSSSALHAEAFAVKEGLILAKSMNATTMCIELDYEQLYNAVVKNSSQISWSIYPLLVDIKRLKIGLLSCMWSLVKRFRNAAGKWLARQAKKGMYLGDWINHPPLSLQHVLRLDGLPAPPLDLDSYICFVVLFCLDVQFCCFSLCSFLLCLIKENF